MYTDHSRTRDRCFSNRGAFHMLGHSAVFWTSVAGSASDAWCGRLVYYVNNTGVGAMATGVGYVNKSDGYSVRCAEDR